MKSYRTRCIDVYLNFNNLKLMVWRNGEFEDHYPGCATYKRFNTLRKYHYIVLGFIFQSGIILMNTTRKNLQIKSSKNGDTYSERPNNQTGQNEWVFFIWKIKSMFEKKTYKAKRACSSIR